MGEEMLSDYPAFLADYEGKSSLRSDPAKRHSARGDWISAASKSSVRGNHQPWELILRGDRHWPDPHGHFRTGEGWYHRVPRNSEQRAGTAKLGRVICHWSKPNSGRNECQLLILLNIKGIISFFPKFDSYSVECVDEVG